MLSKLCQSFGSSMRLIGRLTIACVCLLPMFGCSPGADQQAPVKEGVVLYGHSLFTGWRTASKDLKPLPVTNVAFGGSTTPQLIERFHELVLPLAPRLLVLNTGANYTKTASPEEFASAFEQLLDLIHRELPETQVIWLSVSPSPKGWSWLRERQLKTSELGRKLVEQRDYAHYLDMEPMFVDTDGNLIDSYFASDDIHYSRSGYKDYTRYLKPKLTKHWDGITQTPAK